MNDGNGGERVIYRRYLLRRAAVLAGVAGLLSGVMSHASRADEKMSQKDAEYQATPKNGQTCRACEQFTAPAGCKIVVGKISPEGWCQFFAAKAPR